MGRLKKIIGALLHAPERFDELAQRIADVSRTLDGRTEDLHGRIDGTTRRVDSLETRMQEADERFAGEDRRIRSAEDRMDGMDRETEWIHRRIDSVEAQADAEETGETEGDGIPGPAGNDRVLAEIREAAAARSADEAIPAFGDVVAGLESETGEPEKEREA